MLFFAIKISDLYNHLAFVYGITNTKHISLVYLHTQAESPKSKRIHLDAPKGHMTIETVEMHTGGEPVRIIVRGYPEIKGSDILEKRRYVKENLDHIRKMLMLEPRGHDGMYGVLIVEKDLPEADMAVLFLHGEGKIVHLQLFINSFIYIIYFNINPSHNFFINQIMYTYVCSYQHLFSYPDILYLHQSILSYYAICKSIQLIYSSANFLAMLCYI